MGGDLRFVFVGDGHPNNPYTSEIKLQMGRLKNKWPNKVAIVHNADHAAVNRAFDGLQVFVYSSEFEPFGTKAAVALKKGVPCVLSPVGGLMDFGREYDLITKEGNAVFLSSAPQTHTPIDKRATEIDLHRALLKLISLYRTSPKDRERIRQNARDTDLRWEPSVRAYVHVYQNAISDKKLDSARTGGVLSVSGMPLVMRSVLMKRNISRQYILQDLNINPKLVACVGCVYSMLSPSITVGSSMFDKTITCLPFTVLEISTVFSRSSSTTNQNP